MNTIIFDGKALALNKERYLKIETLKLKKRGVIPLLVLLLIDENPASKIYASLICKKAKKIGFNFSILNSKPANKKGLIKLIHKMNKDKSVNGIVVQMPLPQSFSEEDKEEVIKKLCSQKDVDGLRSDSFFLRPTSKAIIEIIESARKKISPILASKALRVVLVGATGTVGRSLTVELKIRSFNLIECDNKTTNLKEKTLEADILISATGKTKLITEDMVKRGAIVIDAGSPEANIDFENVSKKAFFITPVPGGVGPVTITCLLENLIQSTKDNLNQHISTFQVE